MSGSLSIVVPALTVDARTVDRLRRWSRVDGVREVLLVTPGCAPRSSVAPRVWRLSAPLGRGSQLNAGAAAACGESLLFLHADTEVAAGAISEMVARLAERGDRAYAFSLRFDTDLRSLRFLERLAAIRDRLVPFPLGDQGLGVSRHLFFTVGGFPDVPLFEDLTMTRALRRRATIRVLEAPARTAADRMSPGVALSFARNALLTLLFALGVPPRRLAGAYYGRDYVERWHRASPARRERPAKRRRSRAVVFLGLVLIAALAFVSDARGAGTSHELLDRVLARHVRDGRVDYAALAAEDADGASDFSRYLADLAAGSPGEEMTWSRGQRLAYWINAYNAFTLKLIVDHYPIQPRWYVRWFPFLRPLLPPNSILMIAGRWDRIHFETARGAVTLGYIEHGILRPEFDDPRIHFAIVCASLGCPVLSSSAFHGERIDEELDTAAAAFIRDPTKVVAGDDRVAVSRIFDWFREDFDRRPPLGPAVDSLAARYGRERDVVRWLDAFGTDELRERLAREPFRLRYLRYDWRLNDVETIE